MLLYIPPALADAWRTIMHESGGKTYRPWEPERYRHEAQSPAGKLPEGDLWLDPINEIEETLNLRM